MSAPLPRADWAHLIPHAGAMCLLDAVLAWDASRIHAVSDGPARAGHPLRSAAGLHAVHLAEYGAQAAAVHGALCDRARGVEAARPGRIASLRGLELAVEYVDGTYGRLDVHAECVHGGDAGAQYAFRVEQAGRLLAAGRVVIAFAA